MTRKQLLSSNQIKIRIVIMLIGLLGVLYAMKRIQTSESFSAIFGDGAAPTVHTNTVTRGKFLLCPTRMAELKLVHSNPQVAPVRIYQKGIQWMAETSHPVELAPLFMEKWLAEHCEVQVSEFLETAPEDQPIATLFITLIDGKTLEYKYHSDKSITGSEVGTVRSEEFDQAIQKLEELEAN